MTKTPDGIRKRYNQLVDDIRAIESGRARVPNNHVGGSCEDMTSPWWGREFQDAQFGDTSSEPSSSDGSLNNDVQFKVPGSPSSKLTKNKKNGSGNGVQKKKSSDGGGATKSSASGGTHVTAGRPVVPSNIHAGAREEKAFRGRKKNTVCFFSDWPNLGRAIGDRFLEILSFRERPRKLPLTRKSILFA